MRDLIIKLRALQESKEREKIVQPLRDGQAEKNDALLEWKEKNEIRLYSEAEMIRHEISFLDELMSKLDKVKDKETKQTLFDDLNQSKGWRIDRLLGRTHEYKLNNIIDWDAYDDDDIVRTENRWIELFNNLPTKIANELELEEKKKAAEELAQQQADYQQQLDALNVLESEGL